MAGLVHDIGKIHVPAEILASPAKLSEAEFAIIRTHPLAGWEILKVIDFPWPVAEIVHQHHERLDGSGYPRRLKGGEILPEARPLAVADVVEAMASHRPYRPALGIFAALQEISQNKDHFYDPAAVEAMKGFGLAVDDYGTGFASFALLARVPFTERKIDQCFVTGCGEHPTAHVIVKASLALAQGLKLKFAILYHRIARARFNSICSLKNGTGNSKSLACAASRVVKGPNTSNHSCRCWLPRGTSSNCKSDGTSGCKRDRSFASRAFDAPRRMIKTQQFVCCHSYQSCRSASRRAVSPNGAADSNKRCVSVFSVSKAVKGVFTSVARPSVRSGDFLFSIDMLGGSSLGWARVPACGEGVALTATPTERSLCLACTC